MLTKLILLIYLFEIFGQVYLYDIVYYPSKSEYSLKRDLNNARRNFTKRSVDPVFHGYPKTREELWRQHFLKENNDFDQSSSMIKLIKEITMKYLNDCTPVILYDSHVDSMENLILQNLFKDFPVTYLHGQINDDNSIVAPKMLIPVKKCLHFVVFLSDVMRCDEVIGLQARSKVVVVSRSSQWRTQEFLSSPASRKFVNLLIIVQTFKDDDSTLEAPYVLYTHKLYVDGLGASKPIVLTSWIRDKFSRDVNLFPEKMKHGYAGHRFAVSAANQPPFVFRRVVSDSDGGNPRVVWDGVEYRILTMLGKKLNFSIEIKEPKNLNLGSGEAVAEDIINGQADIGIGGLYVTWERTVNMDMSERHTQDCATFITLTSTALPRYRAIMGPFHWHVWLALTFTYLIGILPLAFSDKHTLKHLWHNPGEAENMFWYVFGTFTNCFTFVGKNSWSKTTKITTRLLIGWYWIFTIIITSCYTGSIIAFVTLPVFPETVDTIEQLLHGFYRLGTLDRGGWESWFSNSSDEKTNKLLERLELVPDINAGIRNTTQAFFWPYAFLGSKAELEFLVQANFSTSKSKRSVLHISKECLVPFGVALAFPVQSVYTQRINYNIMVMLQSGLIKKIFNDVSWDMQRSATGKLLAADSGTLKSTAPEEKGLTLDDTQGMFLLLAAGFIFAAGALLSEWMGGCRRKYRGGENVNSDTNADDDDVDVNKTHHFATKKNQIRSKSVNSNNTKETQDKPRRSIGSIIDFGFRTCSNKSSRSIEGAVIELTKETIDIHNNFLACDFDVERRSSSIDLDKEIEEIFKLEEENHSISLSTNEESVSRGLFGSKL